MADLLQILKGTGAKPRITFYANGVPSDLDSGVPVVTITKPDGTTIASGTVTKVAATTGIYEFTLAAQAECTYLTVTWAGPIGGVTETLTTFVEVVGAHLFTLAGLRAVKVGSGTPFSDTTAYPDATLLERRTEVTEDFARRCGWSFVPKFRRKTLNGDGSTCLNLPDLKAHRLISVTVNGAAQTVTNYQLNSAAQIEAVSGYGYGTPFTWGRRNVIVEYVHGWEQVPPAISSAALARAAMLLLPSLGSTVSTWTTPDGTTYQNEQAGQALSGGGTRFYGVPRIDADLNDPAYNARGLMVA